MDFKMSAFLLCFTGLFICASLVASATLVTINGELVQIVDNCTVGVDATCPSGHCCVSEGLAYIPEYTGPKPTHMIACKPYRQHNEFCYKPAAHNLHEFCPCAPSLTCTSVGIFGHCA